MSEARQTEIMEQAFIPLSMISTDAKPTTNIEKGQLLFEYDTGRVFSFTGSCWVVKTTPDYLFSATTIDLNQAAADYDLYTVGTSNIMVLEFGLIIPADLTGAAAGALTSVSVQSTDDTPVIMISSATGAKANLTSGKHLLYTGADAVVSSKKIQLTIAGGATTSPQVCSVWVKYMEIV